MAIDLSRRRFLAKSAVASASFYLLPHAIPIKALADDEVSPSSHPGLGFFSDDERDVLGKLCDDVLPGAASLGAVPYIENLLTAFEVDPPRIFAGGPFSGRRPYSPNLGSTSEPPVNSFKNFVPLSRAQEAAWKLRLYGSSAFPGGWWNEKALGRRDGLRDIVKRGIADASSQDNSDVSFNGTRAEFRDALKELVVEGSFAAPEYGGNFELRGWQLASFPGDSQPQGYTDAEVSNADARDPNPMGFLTRAFLYIVGFFHKGKVF